MRNRYAKTIAFFIDGTAFNEDYAFLNRELSVENNPRAQLNIAVDNTNDPSPLLVEEDFLYSLRTIISNFVQSFQDGLENDAYAEIDLRGRTFDLELITTRLARGICTIFEIERSLYDEKKTHYELKLIARNLREIWKQLNWLFEREFCIRLSDQGDVGDVSELKKVWAVFRKYVFSVLNKSSRDWTRNDSFFVPYENLSLLDQVLESSTDNKTGKPIDVSSIIDKYYTSIEGVFRGSNLKNLRGSKKNIGIDYSNVTMVDLYIYFGYLKNHLYPPNQHFQAFNEMLEVFGGFFSVHGESELRTKIDLVIHGTNRTYFSNYIISTFASALLNDLSGGPKTIKEIDTEILRLFSALDGFKDSYFSFHKRARLYLHSAKRIVGSYDEDSGTDQDYIKSLEYISKMKECVHSAIRLYGSPKGALACFYVDRSISDASGVFSPFGFRRIGDGDFNARLFKLQFDGNQGEMDCLLLKQRADMRKLLDDSKRKTDDSIKESIDQSEKRVQRGHVEILSIFAAFVVFVSGNIQLFQYVSGLKPAIVFMIGFAATLALFVSLLRQDRPTKTQLVTYAVIALVSALAVFWGPEYELRNEKFIDSIKKEIVSDIRDSKDLPDIVKEPVRRSSTTPGTKSQ